MKSRAVFLDRDGVINEPIIRDGKPYPPRDPDQLVIVPRAKESLERLKAQGFLLVVVTNQPDVRRGKTSLQEVHLLHSILLSQLPIDDFFICAHDDADSCSCRKPAPGLIEQAAAKHQIQIDQSFLIGDRWRDIDAGIAAGCKTILIDRHYDERGPSQPASAVVSTLEQATEWILQHNQHKLPEIDIT